MIIAKKRLFLREGGQETAITISIYAPEQMKNHGTCKYSIDWPEGLNEKYVTGIDTSDALILTYFMIGAELYSSSYHASGILYAEHAEKGYGFPLQNSLRHMLVGVDAIVY